MRVKDDYSLFSCCNRQVHDLSIFYLSSTDQEAIEITPSGMKYDQTLFYIYSCD